MKKKKEFVIAGVGFGDILPLVEDIMESDKSLKFLGFIDDKKIKKIKFKKIIRFLAHGNF